MKVPITNRGAMPIYVASVMILPGETRHFDPEQLPPEFRPAAAPAAAETKESDSVAELARRKAAEIAGQLGSLSDEDLQRLGALEQARGGAARKSVLEAIAAEQLRRAEARAGE